MADEIVVIESDAQDQHVVGFLYPIAVPKQIGGVNVSPNGAAPQQLNALLTQAEKDAIAAGTLTWELWRGALSAIPARALAQLREQYAASKSRFDAKYTARYANTGLRITPT